MIKKILRLLKGGEYLPAWELNASPRILVAFEMDFLNHLQEFRLALPVGQPFAILLQVGYTLEVPRVAENLNQKLKEARKIFPEARIIVLTNTAKELDCLSADTEKIHCSHNTFLDPRRYPLASPDRSRYDAIYVARFTPCKRHLLAKDIKRLHLVGSYLEKEKDYALGVLGQLQHARWDRKIPGFLIGKAMGEAVCGLALSDVEGAMFAMSEYALCGIPVVNTPSLGGREELVPDFAIREVEPTVEAVTQGVQYWLEHPIPPQEIRQAFLENAQVHRRRLQNVLAEIIGREIEFPHKLNVRCRLWPWQYWSGGIRVKSGKSE